MLKERAAPVVLRVVGLGLGALLGATAYAQVVERRLSVTSIQVIRTASPAPKVADEKAGTNTVKKPPPADELSVGERETLKVRFQLSPDVASNKVPKEPMRLGLFLQRDQGAVASVQRGTLDSCSGRFCVATFAGTADMQFYAYEIPNPGKWFVQMLQNPILEERLLESDISQKKGGLFDFKVINVGVFYGRQSITLTEDSSTIFNSAKDSQRISWGAVLRVNAVFDNWEAIFNRFRAQLDTRGFFIDTFVTNVSDVEMNLAYNFNLSQHFGLGLGVGRNTFTFRTTNDDEAILSSAYSAWMGDLRFRYFAPYELFRMRGGRDVLDWGLGSLVFAYGFLGNVTELSEFKRGDESRWKTWRLTYEHAFEFRSTMLWLDRIRIGVGGQFVDNGDVFKGPVTAPFAGLPENTQTTGHQLSWKAFIGREFRFK